MNAKRVTLIVLIVAACLAILIPNAIAFSKYVRARNLFCSASPAQPLPSLAQLKSQGLHGELKYDTPNCLSSLETTQVGLEYIGDGFGYPRNSFIHGEIIPAPDDFDVKGVNTQDLATNAYGSDLWYITPKRWGLDNFGFKTSTYQVFHGRNINYKMQGTFYARTFVDPQPLTLTWFAVHMQNLAWLGGALIALLVTVIGGLIVAKFQPKPIVQVTVPEPARAREPDLQVQTRVAALNRWKSFNGIDYAYYRIEANLANDGDGEAIAPVAQLGLPVAMKERSEIGDTDNRSTTAEVFYNNVQADSDGYRWQAVQSDTPLHPGTSRMMFYATVYIPAGAFELRWRAIAGVRFPKGADYGLIRLSLGDADVKPPASESGKTP